MLTSLEVLIFLAVAGVVYSCLTGVRVCVVDAAAAEQRDQPDGILTQGGNAHQRRLARRATLRASKLPNA